MKKLKFKLLTLLLLLSAGSMIANGDPKLKEYVKTITESASIDSDGEIYIENQFGKVTVLTSNSDHVDITISITIDTDSQENANAFFERIYVDIDHDDDLFEVSTSFDSPNWWNKMWKTNNDYKYTIDMEINIPSSCDVELVNRHGDAFIDNLSGELNLDLSFGKAECKDVGNDLLVELQHADATFNNVPDTELDIQYGKFICQDAGDIEANSQFSKIVVESAKEVDVVSQYDEYSLGSIYSFDNEGQFDDIQIGSTKVADLETQYSKIVIDYLVNSGDFETQFGSLHIKDSDSALDHLDFESQYTQISAYVNKSYTLDLESQFASVKLDSDLTIIERDKSIGQLDILGYLQNKNADLDINAELQFGSFKLRHK